MKKAQANPQQYISLLIFVIGVILIFYILMLPPKDRADLLDQKTQAEDDTEKDVISVLLLREPGTLRDIPETEIILDLPAFEMFSRTDSKELVQYASIY